MKGSRSGNEFFQNYPELLVFSYQGSKTSISEGIQKVLKKKEIVWRKTKKKINKIKII